MKKITIFLYTLALVSIVFTGCKDDYLETSPTDRGSGEDLFKDATTALTPLNGIYRMMYTQGWSTTGNVQQCDGVSAWTLMADLMGEDMVMKAAGSGWYWYDCIYDVKDAYTSSAWRSYDLWNGYYKLIANANFILARESTLQGDKEAVNYVIGQAYALRAYCYHYLAMMFSRTYIGHEIDPGVPLYTEPTQIGTAGKPRGTLAETYTQIRSDIDKAIELLKDAPTQAHKTHIDYYVANGIKARICLTTNEWAEAEKAAHEARQNYSVGTGTALTSGMNDRDQANIMWAAEIIDTQTPGWGPFLYHIDALSMMALDPPTQNYAYRAPKCINALLYAKLGSKDIRRQWWNPNQTSAPAAPYLQIKFRFSNAKSQLGDKIWMRVEEMLLTEAEAMLRQGKEAQASSLLTALVRTRDPEYATTKTGTELGALTTDETGSLLEEILIQRRIELWGEYGRIYDIKRLKQGFQRTSAMGWPASALIQGVDTRNPETYAWVMTIPQSEFDGNSSLNFERDQNPIGDQK